MIGFQQAQDIASATMRPGQTQSEIYRFGAGIDQEDRVQAFWSQGRKSVGEIRDGTVVKTRIRVEQRPLSCDGCSQGRMPVAENAHVVDHIQIGTAVDIKRCSFQPRSICGGVA